MPDGLEKLLLVLGALAVVILVGWLISLLVRVAVRSTRAVATALATGGISLFAPKNLEAPPVLSSRNRTPVRVVLDAIATGGVSVFAEPPRTSRPAASSNQEQPPSHDGPEVPA